MCSCCSQRRIDGTNSFFSRFSKSYAKKFRKKGLDKVQKYLLEGIRVGLETRRSGELSKSDGTDTNTLKGTSILDIGCGIGALHLSLLRDGAEHAIGVDISQGMIDKAREFSTEMKLENQVEYINDDFVSIEDGPGSHRVSISLLDKVVCCYEKVDTLVKKSTAQTKNIYALSFPRDRALIRIAFRIEIFFAELFRFKFHPFWHNWQGIHESILSAGFERVYTNQTFIWDIAAYRRRVTRSIL